MLSKGPGALERADVQCGHEGLREGDAQVKRNRRKVSIPRAHLREDIREARAMVRELQRGIRRDEKALGAMPEEHAAYARKDVALATKELDVMESRMKEGDCMGAVRASIQAVAHLQSAMAEANHGKGGPNRYNFGPLDSVRSLQGRVNEKVHGVLRQCVVKGRR